MPHALVLPGVVAQLAGQLQRRLQHLHHDASVEMAGAGRPFSESRLRGHRRDARVASVSGDDPRLIPGHAFALEGHP
ncbi:hypothetical protein IGA75_31850, partial [Pseudomonas aeruginosa]|nr:hypothetical protein [Pseudomonas aeruginosa]